MKFAGIQLLAVILLLEIRGSDFAPGVQVGQITNRTLADLSGIVASQKNPGVLWVHNDLSRPQIYAVSTNGLLLATWTLGQTVSDLEDIAIGPGPAAGVHYIYVGDIGDNAAARPTVRIFRAPEPAVYPYQESNSVSRMFNSVEAFTVRYPDGSHNAEELMVDPVTGDLLILTKEANRSRIYRAEQSRLTANATVALSFVQQIEFDIVSAGDIRWDGSEIIIRQEEFAKVWLRGPGQSIGQALEGVASLVPVIGTPTEPNGEGISYAGNGFGYYTISEGANPRIYFFERTNALPSVQVRHLLLPGSEWRYDDKGVDPGGSWSASDFNDGDWRRGNGQFGYGEGDERTMTQKQVATYFRRQFTVEDVLKVQRLALHIVSDDGFAVYLNGTEVLRRNLAHGATFSDSALESNPFGENVWQTFALTNSLRHGTNTLAVEVHRVSNPDADFGFDLQISASDTDKPVFLRPFRRSAGSWEVNFQAFADGLVSVERSSDLRNWLASQTLLPTNGLGKFEFSPDFSAASMFYRLRQ